MPTLNSYPTPLLHSADRSLDISPIRGQLDPFALKALKKTEQYFQENYPNSKASILQEGLTGRIDELSKRLDHSGLDDISRTLLATPDIYAAIIVQALRTDGARPDDVNGLYNSVLRLAKGTARQYFLARLLTEVLNTKRIQIKTSNKQWQRLDDLALQRGLPIKAGMVEPGVTELLSTLYREGNLPYFLKEYIKRSAIAPTAFTANIRQGMLNYLVKLGVNIQSEENFHSGIYDEYFILAYHEALRMSQVTDDPIDVARFKGNEISWDFAVDTFDAIDAQGVIPANIRATGALDYISWIGEQMHVFDVTNALVLRWASGLLDIPEGKTATALYRFHKLRMERNTAEERAMLYKRVLNRGEGQLLAQSSANEAFPRLWHQLMSEVAEYIRKSEGSRWHDGRVSRAPIYQATKNLQYNLSEHMTGMAHLQVTEDYAHLLEALDILKSEEITQQFGGRRKSLWSVIEQVAKEDLGMMVPTSTLRTVAVEGNKVFEWIASFDEGIIREEAFRSFLRAGEAWIIAQASMEYDTPSYSDRSGEEDMYDGDSYDRNGGSDSDNLDDWDF